MGILHFCRDEKKQESSAEVWILRDRPSCCSRWPIDRHERNAPENETGKSILISHEMGLTLYAN
jgi:hypothetical protein